MTHITMTPSENQFFHSLNQIQGCHGTGKIGNLDVHFSRWEKKKQAINLKPLKICFHPHSHININISKRKISSKGEHT